MRYYLYLNGRLIDYLPSFDMAEKRSASISRNSQSVTFEQKFLIQRVTEKQHKINLAKFKKTKKKIADYLKGL